MELDIKSKIEELYKKISSDEKLIAGFKTDPVKTVEKLIGIDLPDEKIQPIVDGLKAKLGADKLSDIAGKLGGLFK